MEILRIDLDDNGVYANISFVDFVSLAMSLTLYTATSSERSPQPVSESYRTPGPTAASALGVHAAGLSLRLASGGVDLGNCELLTGLRRGESAGLAGDEVRGTGVGVDAPGTLHSRG